MKADIVQVKTLAEHEMSQELEEMKKDRVISKAYYIVTARYNGKTIFKAIGSQVYHLILILSFYFKVKNLIDRGRMGDDYLSQHLKEVI